MNFVKKYWIGISGILLISVIGYTLCMFYAARFSSPSYNMGVVTGRTLIGAFLCFFAGNSLRVRINRKRLEFGILCFAISFAIFSVSDMRKTNKMIYQRNNFLLEIARIVKSGPDAPVSQKPPYSSNEFGEFSELLRLIKSFYECNGTLSADINKATIDFEDHTNSLILIDIDNLQRLRSFLKAYSDKLDSIEKTYRERIGQFTSKFENVRLEKTDFNNGFIQGCKEEIAKSETLIQEYFHLKRCEAQQADKIYHFLFERTGYFLEIDDGLIFVNEDDQIAYNSLSHILGEYLQKEEDLLQKFEMRKQEAIQRLDKQNLLPNKPLLEGS